MSKSNFMGRVGDICQMVTMELDYELVDVEYVKEQGDYYLRVYIHKPGGVNLDDCQAVSEKLSEKLDEEDVIQKAYYLEVSSPGLDRPLKTDKDLERNLGKEIEVNLYKAVDGSKKYEGILDSYDGEHVVLRTMDSSISLSRETISLIRLTIKF